MRASRRGFGRGACRACTRETTLIRTADTIPPGQRHILRFLSGSPGGRESRRIGRGKSGGEPSRRGSVSCQLFGGGEDVAVWSALYTVHSLRSGICSRGRRELDPEHVRLSCPALGHRRSAAPCRQAMPWLLRRRVASGVVSYRAYAPGAAGPETGKRPGRWRA